MKLRLKDVVYAALSFDNPDDLFIGDITFHAELIAAILVSLAYFVLRL